MIDLETSGRALVAHQPIPPAPVERIGARALEIGRRRRRRRTVGAAIGAALLLGAVAVWRLQDPGTSHERVTTTPAPPSTTATATSVPAGTTYLPPQLAFADTANGWMASAGSCWSGSCADPIMRHTTDSGQTWSDWSSVPATDAVQLTPEARRNLGGLVILDFADPKDGWYGQGGYLWSTHDSGDSWQPVALAGDVLAMTSTGEMSWALVSRCPKGTTTTTGHGAVQCPMVLLNSPSDHDAWTQVPGALPDSGGGDLVADVGSVWVLTGTHLLRAEVAGSLREVTAPCSGQPGMGAVRVLPIAIGRVGVLCTGMAVNGADNTLPKAVVESTDAGQHWQLFATAPSTGWAGWATSDFEGAVFVDTDGQTLWRSTGGPWSPVFRVPAPTGGMDQVLVVSPRYLAYVVVDGGDVNHTVWVSHDDGQTWAPVPLS